MDYWLEKVFTFTLLCSSQKYDKSLFSFPKALQDFMC